MSRFRRISHPSDFSRASGAAFVKAVEETLLAHPALSGLVFGSFRFDNPGPIARGDWRA
jgi:hypothetical protein